MTSQTSKTPNTITYCGLYCPKCYKMKIASAAKQLLAELESAKDKGAKYLKETPELKPILKKLISLKCKKYCRDGGGKSKICPIKSCCKENKVEGCWLCPKLDSCKKLKPHFLKNNKKIKGVGLNKYITQYK